MNRNFEENKVGIDRPFTQIFLLGILLLLMAFLTWQSPFFLKWNNIRNILDHASLPIIMSVGMTFVIAAKGIDLSVGSIVSLSGISIGLMMKSGMPILAASISGIIIGGLLGSLNGFIISKLKIAPYVVTIGSMSLYRGMSLVITKGNPIYGFPKEFTYFGRGDFGKINPPIVLAAIIILFAGFVLKYTKWGQYALAIGSNEEALRRVGVPVDVYKTTIYIVSGLAAGIGGLLLTSRLNAVEPNAGLMLESDVIAAVILGGTNMKGGKASISGTVIACLLLGVMRNGLTMLSISSYYQQLFIGFIIIASVSISEIRQRKQIQIL